MSKPKPKNQRSKRTSMWLDNGLRAALDRKATAEGRSLASTIDVYLRKGLGMKPAAGAKTTQPESSDGTIFG